WAGRPDDLDRSHAGIQRHHDQVGELERVFVGVAQARIEHELQGEAGATVGRLTLKEIAVRESLRVSRGSRLCTTGNHVQDGRSEPTSVLVRVLWDSCWPHPYLIAAL